MYLLKKINLFCNSENEVQNKKSNSKKILRMSKEIKKESEYNYGLQTTIIILTLFILIIRLGLLILAIYE